MTYEEAVQSTRATFTEKGFRLTSRERGFLSETFVFERSDLKVTVAIPYLRYFSSAEIDARNAEVLAQTETLLDAP